MHMSLKQILETPRGIATVVLECVSFAAMLPFVYIEIRTVQEYWDDWLNAWNFLDVAAYAFQAHSIHISCSHMDARRCCLLNCIVSLVTLSDIGSHVCL